MKKYRVNVMQVKEYEIEIDETKYTDEVLEEFESAMFKLDKEDDKISSLMHFIGTNLANETNFECLGYPLLKGKHWNKEYEAEGINVVNVDDDYENIEVSEIK